MLMHDKPCLIPITYYIFFFRRRGGLLNNEKWYYNGVETESVNEFSYLGVVFNYTGTFVLNQQYVSGKALKAMRVLMQNIRTMTYHPKQCVSYLTLLLYQVKFGDIRNPNSWRDSISSSAKGF